MVATTGQSQPEYEAQPFEGGRYSRGRLSLIFALRRSETPLSARFRQKSLASVEALSYSPRSLSPFLTNSNDVMTRRLLPILLLLFAFASTAAAQVETLWERTVPNHHPDWFGTGTERGMAYGEVDGNARLYVASRSTTPNVIRIINAETGADVGTLSSAGVAGGYLGAFLLNDVAVSDDGIIFASNMELSVSADAPFRIYRWDNETADPVRVINYTGGGGIRLGDRITVTGSAEDNSLVIYAAAANVNQIVRFTTTDQGMSFSAEIVTLAGITQTDIFPNVAPIGDGSGDFYFNAGAGAFGTTGIRPRLHRADGAHVATLATVPVLTNTTVYFEAGGRQYLAVNDGTVYGEQTFSIYRLTAGGTNAHFVVRTPSLGDVDNTFGAGDLDVVVEDESTIVLYGLQMNNGLAAFRIDLSAFFEGTFYVGAPGTAPGGADPDYASLAEAFADINAATPSGPVTLLITSDLDERGADLVLNTTLTSVNQLTIRPAPNAQPTVTLGAISAAAIVDARNSGLVIDNTSFVTIDGSNTVGGTTRDLTFLLEDGTGTRVISIVRNASNVTVRNTVVLRETYHAAAEGIRVRRAEDTANEWVPSDIVIENNQIGSEDIPIKDGVGLFGTGTPLIRVGTTAVLGNTIYAGHRGITTFFVEDQTYAGNTIYVTGDQDTPAWYSGIYLAGALDVDIEANEIHLLGANTSAARYTSGVNNNLNAGTINIVNNIIRAGEDFDNRGANTANRVYGIVTHREGAGEVYNVLHNTIRLGDTGETGRHAAIGWEPAGAFVTTGAVTSAWRIVNNIFVIERDAADAYAIHWPVASEAGLESNYNNLYVESAQAFTGHWRGQDQRTLLDWQLATGQDANSVSVPVEFVSETDLRLAGESLRDADLAGTPLAEVTVDIDGNPRNITPYMGAFEGPEFVSTDDQVASPLGFELHQNYPNPFSRSTTISYTLETSGQVTVQVYNAAGQLVRQLVDDYQAPGRHEVRFDASDLASGAYIYRVQVDGNAQTKRMVLVQ
jgi:hypothetical protein